MKQTPESVLVIDIGGTHVKILVTGQAKRRDFDSGPTLTPQLMVSGVLGIVGDWKYDAISIGYPGPVVNNRPAIEPHNLGQGWVDFDYEQAFGHPVQMINDAAMQALGCYEGKKLLFIGLGTGLGTAMVSKEGNVEPLELAHLPYKKGTFEDYVGLRGLKRFGKKRWKDEVARLISLFRAALLPEEVVLGGGNAKLFKELPAGCRRVKNANAFSGGFRLWEKPSALSS
ncbi:MAG TPA: ROK family protein [Chthoniobacterales bacterium]